MNEKMLEQVRHIRDMQYSCWEDYRDEVLKNNRLKSMRDLFEMNVRALDYLMTEVKKHDIV